MSYELYKQETLAMFLSASLAPLSAKGLDWKVARSYSV